MTKVQRLSWSTLNPSVMLIQHRLSVFILLVSSLRCLTLCLFLLTNRYESLSSGRLMSKCKHVGMLAVVAPWNEQQEMIASSCRPTAVAVVDRDLLQKLISESSATSSLRFVVEGVGSQNCVPHLPRRDCASLWLAESLRAIIRHTWEEIL